MDTPIGVGVNSFFNNHMIAFESITKALALPRIVQLFIYGLILTGFIGFCIYCLCFGEGYNTVLVVLLVLSVILYLWLILENTVRGWIKEIRQNHTVFCIRASIILKWAAWLISTGLILGFVVSDCVTSPQNAFALLGLTVLILTSAALSTSPSLIRWRMVIAGTWVQLIMGLIVMKWQAGNDAISWIASVITRFLQFGQVGAAFVFGESFWDHAFAMAIMPILCYFAAVTMFLYHVGLIQPVVRVVGTALALVIDVPPVLAFVAVADIFFGPDTAIMMILSMIPTMSLSGIHTLFCCSLATIDAGMLPLYESIGIPAEHLVSASLMSAPAALVYSKLLFPEPVENPSFLTDSSHSEQDDKQNKQIVNESCGAQEHSNRDKLAACEDHDQTKLATSEEFHVEVESSRIQSADVDTLKRSEEPPETSIGGGVDLSPANIADCNDTYYFGSNSESTKINNNDGIFSSLNSDNLLGSVRLQQGEVSEDAEVLNLEIAANLVTDHSMESKQNIRNSNGVETVENFDNFSNHARFSASVNYVPLSDKTKAKNKKISNRIISCLEKSSKKRKTTSKKNKVKFEKSLYHCIPEALVRGALYAVPVIANTLAMLVSFVSILELINTTLAWFGDRAGVENLTLQEIFSYLFTPLAFVMGVAWEDCREVGRLIGLKTVVNELVAYTELSELISNRLNNTQPYISIRSEAIATYALCGYSNIGTVGFLVGFLSSIAPHRKDQIAGMAFRGLLGGSFACFATACVAGLFYREEI